FATIPRHWSTRPTWPPVTTTWPPCTRLPAKRPGRKNSTTRPWPCAPAWPRPTRSGTTSRRRWRRATTTWAYSISRPAGRRTPRGPADAEAASRRALPLLEALRRSHPKATYFAHALAGSHYSLAALYQTAERFAEAETAYGEALKVQAELAAAAPSDADIHGG